MNRFVAFSPSPLAAAGFIALVVAFAATACGADALDAASPLAEREEAQPRRRMPMANGLRPLEAAKAVALTS